MPPFEEALVRINKFDASGQSISKPSFETKSEDPHESSDLERRRTQRMCSLSGCYAIRENGTELSFLTWCRWRGRTARPCGHGLLSPGRLPIPPRRRFASVLYPVSGLIARASFSGRPTGHRKLYSDPSGRDRSSYCTFYRRQVLQNISYFFYSGKNRKKVGIIKNSFTNVASVRKI